MSFATMPIQNWAIGAVLIATVWFVGKGYDARRANGALGLYTRGPRSGIFKAAVAVAVVTAIAAFGITSWAEVTAPTAPDAITGQVQAWVYRGHTRYVTVAVYHVIQGAMGLFFLSWGIGFAAGITEMIIRKVRGQ